MPDDIVLIGGPKSSPKRQPGLLRVACTDTGVLGARELIHRGCDAIFWPHRGCGHLPERDLRQLIKGVWNGQLLLLVVPSDYPSWPDSDKWVFNWFWPTFWLCVESKPARGVVYADPRPHAIASCLRNIRSRIETTKTNWTLSFNVPPRPDRVRVVDGEGNSSPLLKWKPSLDGVVWPERDELYTRLRAQFEDGTLSTLPRSWKEMWDITDDHYACYGLSRHIDGFYSSPWAHAVPVPEILPCCVTRKGRQAKSLILLSGEGGIGIVPAVLDLEDILKAFRTAVRLRAAPQRAPAPQGPRALTLEFRGDKERKRVPGATCANWTLLVNGKRMLLGHRTYIRLLAFVVAAQSGQNEIDVSDPQLDGRSVKEAFGSRPDGAKVKKDIQDAIYKTPEGGSIPPCNILLTEYGRKGVYWLNTTAVTPLVNELWNSTDPDIRLLLSFLPRPDSMSSAE